MRLFFYFLLFSTSLFAQITQDSIVTIATTLDSLQVLNTTNISEKDTIFSDKQLTEIDSLLVAYKFKSPLVDTLAYVLNDKDIIGNTKIITTKALLKKRLDSLDKTTPFNLAYNPALEKIINSYVTYRASYYPALMAKAKYYFPVFERYLDAYNIPLEVKYLAIVESALRPKANSRVGAKGLWQFMYGTAKQFNLKVSSYVDERQDPVKATIAACKYLSHLYTMFNDWDLALAAYNSGPGNVRKAIKRSGGNTNYWNIRPYLPTETAGYLPAFYATMYVFEYADALNIYPEVPQFYNFETDTIHVKRTVSFAQIAQYLQDIPVEDLQQLNPSYKLDIIPFVKNRPYALRLPSSQIVNFLDKEQAIYELANKEDAERETPLPKYFEMDKRIRYRVKNGDFLGKIANKYGVSVSKIKRWNSLKSSRLKIGQRLYIYPKKIPR